MGKVIALASMSLDGYTAKDDNTIGRLFDWLQNGEVEFTTATEGMTVNLSPQSARPGSSGSPASVPWCAGGPCSTSPTGGAGFSMRETGSPICGSP